MLYFLNPGIQLLIKKNAVVPCLCYCPEHCFPSSHKANFSKKKHNFFCVVSKELCTAKCIKKNWVRRAIAII